MVEYLGSDSHLSLNHPDTHRSLAKEEDKTTEEEILHIPLVRTQCDHYYLLDFATKWTQTRCFVSVVTLYLVVLRLPLLYYMQ